VSEKGALTVSHSDRL